MHPNDKFLEQVPDVLKCFPFLKLKELVDQSIVAGTVELFGDNGVVLDSYEIEIHPSSTYPEAFPFLYEVGGRIPRNIDWHVYTTGVCCLAVPIEEAIACKTGITLLAFIKRYVCGFLYSQTFRRLNGYFYRERPHGIIGSLEYYQEILGLSNHPDVHHALKIASSGEEPKSNSKCFCGSGRKFEKCHRSQLRMLNKMVGSRTRDDFNTINDILNKHKS